MRGDNSGKCLIWNSWKNSVVLRTHLFLLLLGKTVLVPKKFLQIAKMYGMLRCGDKNKLVVGLCKAQLGGLREWEGKLKKQDWMAYANKFEMEEERSLALEHWLGE